MQKAAEHGGSACAGGPVDALSAIVCDLICLIEHVQGSIAAIEAEIAREQLCSSPENAANVIVLDDVTPRYARASAALNACRTGLCTALHSRRQQGRGAPKPARPLKDGRTEPAAARLAKILCKTASRLARRLSRPSSCPPRMRLRPASSCSCP